MKNNQEKYWQAINPYAHTQSKRILGYAFGVEQDVRNFFERKFSDLEELIEIKEIEIKIVTSQLLSDLEKLDEEHERLKQQANRVAQQIAEIEK